MSEPFKPSGVCLGGDLYVSILYGKINLLLHTKHVEEEIYLDEKQALALVKFIQEALNLKAQDPWITQKGGLTFKMFSIKTTSYFYGFF